MRVKGDSLPFSQSVISVWIYVMETPTSVARKLVTRVESIMKQYAQADDALNDPARVEATTIPEFKPT